MMKNKLVYKCLVIGKAGMPSILLAQNIFQNLLVELLVGIRLMPLWACFLQTLKATVLLLERLLDTEDLLLL